MRIELFNYNNYLKLGIICQWILFLTNKKILLVHMSPVHTYFKLYTYRSIQNTHHVIYVQLKNNLYSDYNLRMYLTKKKHYTYYIYNITFTICPSNNCFRSTDLNYKLQFSYSICANNIERLFLFASCASRWAWCLYASL